jgi:hypothetical protein
LRETKNQVKRICGTRQFLAQWLQACVDFPYKVSLQSFGRKPE